MRSTKSAGDTPQIRRPTSLKIASLEAYREEHCDPMNGALPIAKVPQRICTREGHAANHFGT
jgi:hypothetical protein